MKKFTFLLIAIFALNLTMSAQCIRPNNWEGTFDANNNWLVQTFYTWHWSTDSYTTVNGLNTTENYEFTFTTNSDGSHNYITITDTADNVLVHGSSPLQWVATETSIRLHWSDDAACSGTQVDHTGTMHNLDQVQPDPPANDECAQAIAITVNSDLNCGTVTAGTLISATDSGVTPDCGVANDDVWFSFEAAAESHVISVSDVISSENLYGDLNMSIYDGTCGALGASILCQNSDLEVLSGLNIGSTYYVQVHTQANVNSATDFNICIGTTPPPPTNDECSTATPITVNGDLNCGLTISGTTASATASSQPGGDAFQYNNNDVWYSFVAVETYASLEFSNITAVIGTSTYVGFGIYDGGVAPDCNALSYIDYSTGTYQAYSITGMTVGNTYYIRVTGNNEIDPAQVNFDMCLGTPPPPPSNDECAGAENIVVNSDGTCTEFVSGTTVSASQDATSISCAFSHDADVWYSFEAPSSGAVEISATYGTANYMRWAVFSDCAGTQVYCDYGNLNSPQALTGLTGGNIYYLIVWTSNFDVGTFDLCLKDIPCGDPSDMIAGSVAETSFEVSWTAGGSETDWNIEWGVGSDFTPGTGAATGTDTVSGSPTFGLTSLTASTNYYIYFQADCGVDGTSNWIGGQFGGGFLVTTLCAAIDSFPFNNSFFVSPPSACWSASSWGDVFEGPQDDFNNWMPTSYANSMGNPVFSSAMQFFSNYNMNWLITQNLDIPVAGHSLVVDVALTANEWGGFGTETTNYDFVNDDEAKILVTTDNGNSWTAIYTWNSGNEPSHQGTEYIIDLAAYSGQTIQLALWVSDGYVADWESYLFHISKFDIVESSTLSVSDFDIEGFNYFPNPVNDKLSLRTLNAIQNVAIYNMLGQEVMRFSPNVNSTEIDMSELEIGVYFVDVTVNDVLETIKIIRK